MNLFRILWQRPAFRLLALLLLTLLAGAGLGWWLSRPAPPAAPRLGRAQVRELKQASQASQAAGRHANERGDSAASHAARTYAAARATHASIHHLRPTLHERIRPLTAADSSALADSLFQLLTNP